MTRVLTFPSAPVPSETPLAIPVQDLSRGYHDQAAPGLRASRAAFWRCATFLPAILTTAVLLWACADWFAEGGLSPLETVLISLIGFTFFWIALSVSTTTVGIASLYLTRPATDAPAGPLNVALLVPVYNEVPEDVLGNLGAMLAELARSPHPHQFSAFVLSDTRDAAIAAREMRALSALRMHLPEGAAVHYRRRDRNTDRKVGNLTDWVERWGGGYDAMLVLDADSLMSGDAIIALSDALAADPSAGLIQSFPRLIGADTLFGRVQQFASTLYGAALAEGLATWCDREGNYWGHNAIIRTRAFAASAGLPRLRTLRDTGDKGALILSHDFVEAGLLRRAGWGVRFLPRVPGSYEETPATLIDHALRDRRWCQGNLQHLNILGSRGFHAASRFHLFQGAMAYLTSPAWFALLVIWSVIGISEDRNVIHYFSGLNPQVSWPEMSGVNTLFILLFMYGMLLAPKLMGAVTMHRAGLSPRKMGGWGQFGASMTTEIVLSVLYAPIMMVQQTVAVARTALGMRERWTPQARQGGRYGWATLAKFHALETVTGLALWAGIAGGVMTLWLVPIALSLVLAIPLSALSGMTLTQASWLKGQLGTPEVFDAPPIYRAAQAQRAVLRQTLEREDRIAAE